jgi:putative tryptophan/tyrosine transport system substrate-binding protein
MIRRRDFITLLGGTAAWPLAVRAQQQAMPVIGFLSTLSSTVAAAQLGGFNQGLNEAGYVENRNVAIEFRWAEGHYDRLPALAADLVDRRVAVIMAGGPPAALVAKAATSTIPIVFTSGDDPVQIGLVPSLNRPGGNITGVHLFFSELSAKKLGLLHDLLPQVTVVAAMLNPTSPSAERQAKDLQNAGRALGLQIQIVNASSAQETDAAFDAFGLQKVGAVIIGSDPSYYVRREQIVALAARHAIPTVYEQREYVEAGGLMSYGTNVRDGNRLAANYVGRILKGEKPADLPVVQETKFELVFNIKTAKTLGVKIPDNVLSLADEVIE